MGGADSRTRGKGAHCADAAAAILFAAKEPASMRINAFLLCLCLIVTTAGCRPGSGAPEQQTRSRQVVAALYQYVASDAQGSPLVQGELLLPEVSDGDQFAGTWELRFVANDESKRPEAGPQIGIGRLSGQRTGEQIQIDLNPHMRDNNVALAGTISDSGFSGRWEYLTIAGVTNSGTFTATRR
jgi:hypothetical protein